jgi:hypothetical protein
VLFRSCESLGRSKTFITSSASWLITLMAIPRQDCQSSARPNANPGRRQSFQIEFAERLADLCDAKIALRKRYGDSS